MIWKKITNVILKCLHGEIMPWKRNIIIPIYLTLQEIHLGQLVEIWVLGYQKDNYWAVYRD